MIAFKICWIKENKEQTAFIVCQGDISAVEMSNIHLIVVGCFNKKNFKIFSEQFVNIFYLLPDFVFDQGGEGEVGTGTGQRP